MDSHRAPLLYALLGVVAVGVLVVSVFALRKQLQPESPNTKKIIIQTPPEIYATDPTLGPTDARVTVVAFMDFGCAPCARGFSLINELHQRLPKVRFVWKDLAEKGTIVYQYHTAHIAARCAGQHNKFWEYAQELFSDPDAILAEKFTEIAARLAIPKQSFAQCLGSTEQAKYVEEGAKQAHERGIFSTPYFFVNGKHVDGIIPVNTMQQYIINLGL